MVISSCQCGKDRVVFAKMKTKERWEVIGNFEQGRKRQREKDSWKDNGKKRREKRMVVVDARSIYEIINSFFSIANKVPAETVM